MTTVSVIIPARNAGAWIAHAIRSVAAQTLRAHEIIVIDNASVDDTCAVVEGLRSTVPRLILVRNPRDLGPGASRNIGFDRATGAWKALLDADDWWAPRRLEKLIHHAERVGANIVADNQVLTPSAGGSAGRLLFAPRRGEIETVDLEAFLRRDRHTADALGLLKPIFRAAFLEAARVRYDEDAALTLGEDSLFYIRCLMAGGSILLTHEALYYYRQRADSLSHSATSGAFATLKQKNLELLAPLRVHAPRRLARTIDRRIADLDAMVAYRDIVHALSRGRLIEAVRQLMLDPSRAANLLRRTAKACAKRASNRRPGLWIGRAAD